MMVWARVTLALLAALLLSACVDDFEQVAVTASDDGNLRVFYRACESDNVASSLQLLVPVGNVIGDDDDSTLWKVVADPTHTSEGVEVFEPGSVPAGYREVVPLDEPSRGRKVAIYLQTRHGSGAALTFEWGTLESGRLLTEDGWKSQTEWLRYAIDGCRGP